VEGEEAMHCGAKIQTIVLIEVAIIPGMDSEGKGREGRKS
jgi:hypothetical protein